MPANNTNPRFDPLEGTGGGSAAETGMGDPNQAVENADPIVDTGTGGGNDPFGTANTGPIVDSPEQFPLGSNTIEMGAVNPINSPEAVAARAKSQGYTAPQGVVTDNQRSVYQLSNMLNKDSPLAQRARQEGYLNAARRGLRNTSIAGESAFGALVDRSQPFALQDATTYANQARDNTGFLNKASEFTASAANAAEIQNATLATEIARTNASNATSTNMANLQSETSQSVAQLNSDTQMDIALKDNQVDVKLANMDVASRELIANLEADTRIVVAELELNNANAINKFSGVKDTIATGIAANAQIIANAASPEEATKKIAINMKFVQDQIDFINAWNIPDGTVDEEELATGAGNDPAAQAGPRPPGYPAYLPWPPVYNPANRPVG